jgi:hypothetical protein
MQYTGMKKSGKKNYLLLFLRLIALILLLLCFYQAFKISGGH